MNIGGRDILALARFAVRLTSTPEARIQEWSQFVAGVSCLAPGAA